MSRSAFPTRLPVAGFCIFIAKTGEESRDFFVSFDKAAEALARAVDPSIIWGSYRMRVKSRDDHDCDVDASGKCLTVSFQSEQRLEVKANPGKCAHVAYVPIRIETHYEVTDPFGKRLSVSKLLARGREILAQKEADRLGRYYRRGRLSYCGFGPVPGIRKSRGGSGWMRHLHTTPERRLNELVLQEEGEVPVRAARNPSNLPNTWDDFMRRKESCWKSQHKGVRSWDRVQQLSKLKKFAQLKHWSQFSDACGDSK